MNSGHVRLALFVLLFIAHGVVMVAAAIPFTGPGASALAFEAIALMLFGFSMIILLAAAVLRCLFRAPADRRTIDGMLYSAIFLLDLVATIPITVRLGGDPPSSALCRDFNPVDAHCILARYGLVTTAWVSTVMAALNVCLIILDDLPRFLAVFRGKPPASPAPSIRWKAQCSTLRRPPRSAASRATSPSMDSIYNTGSERMRSQSGHSSLPPPYPFHVAQKQETV